MALARGGIVTGGIAAIGPRAAIGDIAAVPAVAAEAILTVVGDAIRVLIARLAVLEVRQADVVAVGVFIALRIEEAGLGTDGDFLVHLARTIEVLVVATFAGQSGRRTTGVIRKGEFVAHEVPARLL